ncbi:MAG: YbjN domain-containing protein [Snowella sp.]|nr:YbjN domain-containing protein [Snowella sp.]
MTVDTPSLETIETTLENLIPQSHEEVIETVISGMAQNGSAMVNEQGPGAVWKFQYGSVEVFVQLTGESDEDLLTIWAAVLQLPVQDEAGLMKKLLTMNWSETLETRFALMNDEVVVIMQRAVADLSPGEISRAITLVATIADDNDDILQETFA